MLRLAGRLLSSEGYTEFPVNSSRCWDYGYDENYVFLCFVAEDSLEELSLLDEEDDEDEEDLDLSSFWCSSFNLSLKLFSLPFARSSKTFEAFDDPDSLLPLLSLFLDGLIFLILEDLDFVGWAICCCCYC